MASEDIGNADPRGLSIAVDALATFERLGSPEGELAIAHALVYLAIAPKSNAVYVAFQAARRDAETEGSLPVPLAIRNAPTRLLKELGHGAGYRYDPDEPGGHAAGQRYFPDEMEPRCYYNPVPRGLEIKIRDAILRRRGGGT
jgi:putative ATPase